MKHVIVSSADESKRRQHEIFISTSRKLQWIKRLQSVAARSKRGVSLGGNGL